jgi:CheY-like chemotaxis protein
MSAPLILVVEHNRTDQQVFNHLLDKFDYRPQIVSSAEAAIEVVKQTRFAVILLNLNLPDMDGLVCAKAIKEIDLELTSQTPIIGIVDQAPDEEQSKVVEVHLNDYLVKPVSPEALRKILLRHAYEPRRPNLKTLIPLSLEEATIPPSLED